MGRRKKKNYQSLGEIQEDNAMRMASDAITEDDVIEAMGQTVLAELRGEVVRDELIQDAMDYLPKRRAELSAMSPAGIGGIFTESRKDMAPRRFKELLDMSVMAEDRLSGLGSLPGDVPMPIIRSGPNGEVRTHVEYEDNDITGQRQVVPFMDPNSPTQALQTVYGRAGVDPDAGHQAEPAMLNALKLKGKPANYNDPNGIGLADLATENRRGDTERIDVMVGTQGKPLELPMYTNLWPKDENGRQIGRDSRDGSAANMALQLVEQKLKEVSGGYQSAVQELVSEGRLGPGDSKFRNGKLLKGDRDSTPQGEHFYDGLIVPRMSKKAMQIRGQGAPQKTPTAPDEIYEVDLQKALNSLNSGVAGSTVSPVVNYGYGGRGHERLQLKPQFDYSQDVGIKDMTIDNPLVQQLLSYTAMQKRLG